MSERTARIRLQLNSASLLGGLGQIGDSVEKLGKRMGAALGNASRDGFGKMKESLAGTVEKGKELIGIAAGIAGGLSVASGAQGAIELEQRFRSIAFAVEQASGEATKWQDVQTRLQAASDLTGQTTEKMAGVFDILQQKSGNARYAYESLGLIGEVMNATGRSGEELGSIVGVLNKKWGITEMGQVKSALLQVFEATKGGKIKFEELSEDIDELGSIAQSAGMGGIDGFRRSLGLASEMAPHVNQSISEVLTGMDQLTEKLRQMPVVKGLAEGGGVAGKQFFDDFIKEGDATKRLELLLQQSAKKGKLQGFRKIAIEEEFTGREERAAFQALANPFVDAFEKAKAAGMNNEKATAEAVKAFDANVAKLGGSTMQWSQIQEKAADNEQSAATKIRQAQEMWQRAFTDPATMDAMGELAQHLPKVASGMADLVKFAVDSPWAAGAAVVGGKAALAGAGGFANSLVSSGLSSLGSALGGTAAAVPAATGAVAKLGNQASLASRAVSGLANASGLEGVAGKGAAAASTGIALAAVGVAAFELTTKLLESRDELDRKGTVRANDTYFDVSKRMSEAKTPEERAKILAAGKQKLTDEIGFWESPAAASASIKALDKRKEELDFKDIKVGATVFEESMSRSADSGDKAGRALERAAIAAERVARAFDKVTPAGGSNGLPPEASGKPGFWE